MTRRRPYPDSLLPPRGRRARIGVAVVLGALLASGCTADPAPSTQDRPANRDRPAGPSLRLVSFDSCGDALSRLRRATREAVGPYGLGFGDGRLMASRADGAVPAAPGAAQADSARGAAAAPPGGGGAQKYSGTNTHEAGVDEPDVVKTDGRRIVTVSRGVLRVVDAQRRTVTGTLKLAPDKDGPFLWSAPDLLLSGDRVLLIERYAEYRAAAGARPISGPSIWLVDISGTPTVLSRYRVEGSLVDARQVGGTVRLVSRSTPRLDFPMPRSKTDKGRVAENRRIVDRAPIEAWLPGWEVTEGGRTRTGRIGCDRLSHPTTFSGTSLITVLTFDLSAGTLGDGDPMALVADGDTVYGTGTSLYVATDERWRFWRMPADADAPTPEQRTEIFQLDTSKAGRPRFVASGTVPGWLVNQYAMSEWDGRLRVATTIGETFGPWGAVPDGAGQPTPVTSSSGVYVLRPDGDRLVEEGRVTGLGRNERIYGVRFVGPTGYVVTFRQVDPLYTVDLSDPARPRVAGELKITGYSAYLHPVGDGRLIGIGQEATTEGRRRGTQVSLFDVSNLDDPRRLAQHHVKDGHSEAEFDPHAFLYWPEDRLLVVPLMVWGPSPVDKSALSGGALVLRLGDSSLTEVGTVRVPRGKVGHYEINQVRRSFVIGDTLWTLSDRGLQAVDSSTLEQRAWVEL